jgi:hypothetical protein
MCRRVVFAAAAAVVAVCSPAAIGQLPLTKVIASGDPAPGLGSITIANIVRGTVNLGDNHLIGFQATLAGTGLNSSNNSAYFSGPLSAPALALRQGGTIAEFPGATWQFGVAGSWVMNQAGQIALQGTLNGGPVPGGVEIFRSDNTWSLLVRAGQPAPDGSGIINTLYYTLTLNDRGEVLIKASFTTGPEAMFFGAPGAIGLVASSGGQVPGQPPGTVFADHVHSSPSMLNGGIGMTNRINGLSSAFTGKPGTYAIVARAGTQANGLAAGVNYSSIPFHPAVNASNHVTFTAELTGGPAGSPTRALYVGPAGNPQPALTNLDPVPSLPGATFVNFGQPVITDSGNVMVYGFFSGSGITTSNNEALFAGVPGNLRLVAREGAQAPGMPAGALFTRMEGPSRGGFGQLVWNDSGQFAFAADITGGGFSDDPAIFATLPSGELVLVAHFGQVFNVNGINRTVSDVSIVGNQVEGHGTSFADNGDLAVQLNFTNGSSAIYRASVVPEPGGALASVGVAMLARRPRRTRRQPAS